MPKLIAMFIMVLFCTINTQAQSSSVHGSVMDTTQKKAVANAVVLMLTPIDSILYKFTRTDANGSYSFKNTKAGDYILMTTHPYFADFLDNISVKGTDLEIPKIALTSKSKLLQEVIKRQMVVIT